MDESLATSKQFDSIRKIARKEGLAEAIASSLSTSARAIGSVLTPNSERPMYGYFQCSPHFVEAKRQAERISPYLSFLAQSDADEDKRRAIDVKQAIEIIYNFSLTRLPIPVASVGEEASTLFLRDANFYGDIEIANGAAEYMLKWVDEEGVEREIVDEEQIEDNQIPTKLLYYLYGSGLLNNRSA